VGDVGSGSKAVVSAVVIDITHPDTADTIAPPPVDLVPVTVEIQQNKPREAHSLYTDRAMMEQKPRPPADVGSRFVKFSYLLLSVKDDSIVLAASTCTSVADEVIE